MEKNAFSLSLVIPVYNEAGNLRPLLDEIAMLLPNEFRAFELIIVNDGSDDGSREILIKSLSVYPFLKVISLFKHSGQSLAFDVGFQAASGTFIATMDGDLQNDPSDVLLLMDALILEGEECDVVTGWRRERKDGFFLRRFPSLIANCIVRLVTRTKIHDLGCSLRVYRSDIIKRLRLTGEMHRYMCPLLQNLGARISEKQVRHRLRGSGKSKYGLGRIYKVPLDLIYVRFNQVVSGKPMYWFGGVGMGLFFMSIVFIFLGTEKALFQKLPIHQESILILGVVVWIFALQFVGLGLLAEILIRNKIDKDQTSILVCEKLGFL